MVIIVNTVEGDEIPSPEQRIKYLDLVLLIFGQKLYTTEGIQNFFNIGLRIACASVYYLNLITFIVITDHREDIFLSLAFIFKYLIFIALHHYFSLQINRLKELFERHQCLAESFDKFESNKINSKSVLKGWVALTLTALVMTVRVVSFDYKAYTKYEKRSQKENIVNAILTTVLMNIVLVIYNFGWLFATFMFYAYIYLLLKELDDNYFRLARMAFATDSASDDLRIVLGTLRAKRQLMQTLKDKTNLYVGLLPFLWFILIYLECSWLVIATNLTSFVSNLGEIIYRSTITLYVAVIILFAEHVHNREAKRTDTLLGNLKTKAEDEPQVAEEKMLFQKEIAESPVIWPKLLNLIPLNKFTLLMLFAITVPSALAIRFFGY